MVENKAQDWRSWMGLGMRCGNESNRLDKNRQGEGEQLTEVGAAGLGVGREEEARLQRREV